MVPGPLGLPWAKPLADPLYENEQEACVVSDTEAGDFVCAVGHSLTQGWRSPAGGHCHDPRQRPRQLGRGNSRGGGASPVSRHIRTAELKGLADGLSTGVSGNTGLGGQQGFCLNWRDGIRTRPDGEATGVGGGCQEPGHVGDVSEMLGLQRGLGTRADIQWLHHP